MRTGIFQTAVMAVSLGTAVANLPGQIVNLGSSSGSVEGIANARYRINQTNWDLAMTRAAINSSADVLGVNLGNESALSGDRFRFTLENRVAQGLIWTLDQNSDAAGPVGGTIAWGTFNPAVPAGLAATEINGLPPAFDFNLINLELRARAPGSSMALEDLAFTAPGAQINGALSDVTVSGISQPANEFVGAIRTDTSFADFNWAFTGYVRGLSSGNTINEGVVFNLKLAQAEAAPIPEPATAAALFAAAIGLFVVARQRRPA